MSSIFNLKSNQNRFTWFYHYCVRHRILHMNVDFQLHSCSCRLTRSIFIFAIFSLRKNGPLQKWTFFGFFQVQNINFKITPITQKSRKPLKQCLFYISSFLRRLRIRKISNFGTHKNLVSGQTQDSNFDFKHLLQRVLAPSSSYSKKEGCIRLIEYVRVLNMNQL